MRKLISLIAIIFLFAITPVKAQDWYTEFSLGITHSLSENMKATDFMNKELPSLAVAVGDNFTPCFGLRFQAAFRPQKGEAGEPQYNVYRDTYDYYRFNTLTGDLDLVVNLSNLFVGVDPLRTFDMSLLAGVGALRTTWFSPKLKDWTYYPVNTEKKTYITYNLGVQGQVRINRHWKGYGEIKGYAVDNAYNGVVGNPSKKLDFFLDFQFGVVYYLSGKNRAEMEAVEVRHNYVPEYNENPIFTDGGASLRNVMFYLGRTNLTTSQMALLADISQFMMEHPNYTLQVCGYPDDENESADANKLLAQTRLDVVREQLISMGVADERLEVSISDKPKISIKDASDWVVGVAFTLKK